MASASYSEDLTCSICLDIFTDPVSLSCGHSYCRECVTQFLKIQKMCPHCRATVPTERSLSVNHILRSLAEKAKEAGKEKKDDKEKKGVSDWLCPEHEEKLKLFCVTDQQLACVICRDGEKHDGHKFKPIKEADMCLRPELERGIENLHADIHAVEHLAKTQREEITKTQETSCHLMNQISTQFEEMYQFLKKREDEMKKALQEKERDAVEKMSANLNAMELALSESRENEVRVKSALDITNPEKFLQSWTEGNTKTILSEFRPRASEHQVTSASVSLGSYDSHLQFFVWKEMLEVIKPLPEKFTLEPGKSNANALCFTCGSTLQTNQSRSDLPLGTPQTSQSRSGFKFGTSQTSQSQSDLPFSTKTSQFDAVKPLFRGDAPWLLRRSKPANPSPVIPKPANLSDLPLQTSQSQLGFKFGTARPLLRGSFDPPRTSQSQSDLPFGTTRTSQSQSDLPFGTTRTSHSQSDLPFSTQTSQSQLGFKFGTARPLLRGSFDPPQTSQSHSDLPFGTTQTRKSQRGFKFGKFAG